MGAQSGPYKHYAFLPMSGTDQVSIMYDSLCDADLYTLELTGHRIEFINTISPPDNILRLAKKEDILAYRTKLKEMGMEIDF